MIRSPRVETICTLEALVALEPEWRTLELSDPKAHIFLSWPWILGRLRSLQARWEVFVVREVSSARLIGLLPLRSLDHGRSWGMAGSPLADMTGLLCCSGDEEVVITALARHLRASPHLSHLELSDVHDQRIELMLERLEVLGREVDIRAGVPCPSVALEEDWSHFLDTRLSASRRATVRRKMRAFERLPELRLTTIEEGGSDSIAALLDLWQVRWGQLDAEGLNEYRSVFEACRREGTLWLDLFWQHDTPITGLLAFLDRRRSWFGFYITAFNSRFARFSPGTVIVGHSLRRAIADGYQTFDFLRGDEAYKKSFGAHPRQGINASAKPRMFPTGCLEERLQQHRSC